MVGIPKECISVSGWISIVYNGHYTGDPRSPCCCQTTDSTLGQDSGQQQAELAVREHQQPLDWAGGDDDRTEGSAWSAHCHS